MSLSHRLFLSKCLHQWNKHDDSRVVSTAKDLKYLKTKHIEEAEGKVAMQEEDVRVFPLTNFPVPEIAEYSRKFVSEHSTKWPMERILKQRHSVKVVPVASVAYKYKDQSGTFFVFGDETDRKCKIKPYPHRIMWCCSIA